MTREELIAVASLESYIVGDCKSLYNEDILKEHGMTEKEMEEFLMTNSEIIDAVIDRIPEKITELAKEYL